MTLEQPGLGSDPPNRSGRERGATLSGFIIIKLFTKYNYRSYLFHKLVAIFLILEVQHIHQYLHNFLF